MQVSIPDHERQALAALALALGVRHPHYPSQPSISGLLRRLAQRYLADPGRVTALVAAAIEADAADQVLPNVS